MKSLEFSTCDELYFQNGNKSQYSLTLAALV